MKPSKVYIKIFISFVIVLIITEIAIFGFVVLFAGRQYRDYYEKYTETRFMMAKEMIEFHAQKTTLTTNQDIKSFGDYVYHLGLAFKTKIWITSEDGRVILKSFEKEIPHKFIRRHLDELKDKKEFGSYFKYRDHFVIYRNSSIDLGDNKNTTFHMLFGNRPELRHKAGFAIGLFSIGLIVALLTFPISRLISKPIKTLIKSTKRLEQGDLSHRTSVKSKDEIGELASAFNIMAEKLENMVQGGKELTAQVSHELRSPLARIQIAVEILKDRLKKTGEEDLSNHLKGIQVDVDELDGLIGRILELSKLDLQQEVPYSEVFSPVRQIEDVVDKFESTLENKKIECQRDFLSKAKIIGNREAFSTAITNLVDNAVKFTPVNGVISLKSEERDSRLVLCLANSCSHVSEMELSRIFEPFYRIDPFSDNGGGLGLAIAKKIIEKHQGTIKAKNSQGGLEFIVELPVVKLE